MFGPNGGAPAESNLLSGAVRQLLSSCIRHHRATMVVPLLAFTAACGIPLSEECPKYIDCLAHYEREYMLPADPAVDEVYGECGTCWQNADTAESCTAACDSANTAMKDELVNAGRDPGPCE